MKSKIRGRNYIILYDGEKYYSKVNKSKLDRSLKRVIDALEVLNGELEYRNDVSELIMDEVFYDYVDDDYSHKKDRIQKALEYAIELKEQLETHDDEIPEPEEVTLLEDIGYKHQPFDQKGYWTKLIENTEDREVIEELWLSEKPIRRKRIIDYEKSEYGRSSTNIAYQNLSIGKRLMKVIENTLVKENGAPSP